MSDSNSVLILFAHPSQDRSEVNLPLYQASMSIEGVTCVDLYAEYPSFRIDIDREQQRLNDHDIIVFMFPLYWYSTPAILKEWQDLVLEYGYAYGAGGTALTGKHFLCALSAGGAEDAYRAEGHNHFTIRELLQPLEQTARLTGMYYLPPFTLFSARTATEDQRVSDHVSQWINILTGLVDGNIDHSAVADFNTLNEALPSLLSDSDSHSSINEN